MTKIYIASSWKNQVKVIALAERLEADGFEVDAFCRATDQRYAFHWSELVDDEAELASYDAIEFLADGRTMRAYIEDKKWLDWADVVIMLMPCGRSSHLEGGYGYGQGKRLFIYGEFAKGEFDVMYGFAEGLYRTEQYVDMVEALRAQLMCATCGKEPQEWGNLCQMCWEARCSEQWWGTWGGTTDSFWVAAWHRNMARAKLERLLADLERLLADLEDSIEQRITDNLVTYSKGIGNLMAGAADQELERVIALIESVNSIGYAYGRDYKKAILQVLRNSEGIANGTTDSS